MAFNQKLLCSTLLGVCAALLTCAALPSCSRGSGGEQATGVRLRLGYRPKALADITPIVIAESGFSTDNVRVELVPCASPGDAFDKLNNGEVDAIAGIPMTTIFKQFQGGAPIVPFVAYQVQVDLAGEGWVSIVGPSAARGREGLKGLRDMTIGSLPTDQAKWLLKRILRAGGLTPQEPDEHVQGADVLVTVYNPLTPMGGIDSGDQQAIFGLEPAIAKARARGLQVIAAGPVSAYLYDSQPVPVSASLVSRAFCTDHPEAYAAFCNLVDRAVEFCTTNSAEVRAYFGQEKYGALSERERALMFFPVMRRPDPALSAMTKRFVEDHVRDGLLENDVPVEQFFPQP